MAMSPEERKRRDAERKRRERAEQRAEEQLAKDAAASARPVGTEMRDEVDRALAAMEKWLVASDGAAVAQARMLARMIDVLEHKGDVVKALNAHGRLTRVLTELGGTPTVRMAHELRSLRAAPKQGAEDERNEGEGGKASAGEAGNVSRFVRPPKRRA